MDRKKYSMLKRLFIFIVFVIFANANYAQQRIETVWQTKNNKYLKVAVYFDLINKNCIKVTKLVNESEYAMQFSLAGSNDADKFRLKPFSIKKCDCLCFFVFVNCKKAQLKNVIISPEKISKWWDDAERKKKRNNISKKKEHDTIKNSPNIQKKNMMYRTYNLGKIELRLCPINDGLVYVTQIKNISNERFYVRFTKNDTGNVAEYLIEAGEGVLCDKITENIIVETFDRTKADVIWNNKKTKFEMKGGKQSSGSDLDVALEKSMNEQIKDKLEQQKSAGNVEQSKNKSKKTNKSKKKAISQPYIPI